MTIETITPSSGAAVALPEQTLSAATMTLAEWAQEARAAYSLAEMLAQTPFAGSWKGNPQGAAAAILKGSEVGLTPVTALGAFDNIQGTPAPKAITLRALVQSHGHDLEIIEETPERAVARYRRKGASEWRTTEFTLDDAARMNLLGKDNWKKQPGAMLVARVTSKAARLVASDVILGIGYSAEEVADSDDWQRPAPAAPTASADHRLRAALNPSPAPDAATSEPAVDDAAAPLVTPQDAQQRAGEDSPLLNTSSKLAKALYASLREHGIDKAGATQLYREVTGRHEIESSKELTDDEARAILRELDERTGDVSDAELVDESEEA